MLNMSARHESYGNSEADNDAGESAEADKAAFADGGGGGGAAHGACFFSAA